MQLKAYIPDDNIELDFTAKDKEEALLKLSYLISKGRKIDPEKILEVLKEREELGSTGIGNEIAIPHGKMEMSSELIGAIAISRDGVEFDSIDGKPVKIFFVFISSPEATGIHLKVLARVSKLLMDEKVRKKLMDAKNVEDIKSAIEQGGAK